MADTPDFPVSYKDPLYASLDSATEQKLGLPDGLLSGIRTDGERSNADQVSSAGARTPYQITPSTRQLAIKQFGIDPYLSPQNASQVAGLLLKDSLTRNQGDPSAAVGEYHGGTDRANWGPKTQAYIARVTGALPQGQVSAGNGSSDDSNILPPFQGQSTFDKALAQQQQQQAPNQIAAIYQAYKSGQMTPDETQQFESDVRSGAMMLPRGASLNGAQTGGSTSSTSTGAWGAGQQVPDGVMQAFARGDMTPQEMTDFEHDVRAGAWKLPPGMDMAALFGTPSQPKGLGDRIADVGHTIANLPANIQESITGAQRRTPETDAAPD